MKSIFTEQILDPFLFSLQNFPDKNCFHINEKFYTYEEFSKSISKIRISLEHQKINSNVGLVVNDDIETYASIFAIWLEGLAYVPLHPLQPLKRNKEIIDQADIDLILVSNELFGYEEFNTIVTCKLEFDKLKLKPKLVNDDSLAYILFTSGSTGTPKGVQISRNNIGSFMKSFWETGIIISENDKCLQCFDLTFDVSIQSYLTPLTRGACTYTVPHNEIKYSYVFGLLDDHELTFGAMPPSMIRLLRPYFEEINISSMRYNILTAEASPLELITEWASCIPNAEIYNFYGPTEATIYCSYNKFYRSKKNKQVNGMFSIGKIMSGINSIVIDKKNNILKTGIKGELAVSGSQITKGYWQNKLKNEESFFNKKINGVFHRFYKTGDSCYFDSDGDIMLFGRLDNQVKIQGYRIELGELEYHSREVLEGGNTVAIVVENNIGNNEIILFIEEEDSNKVKIVSEYLKQKLPSYMIPKEIKLITPFPINNSGKVDRQKLKKMAQ